METKNNGNKKWANPRATQRIRFIGLGVSNKETRAKAKSFSVIAQAIKTVWGVLGRERKVRKNS